MSVQEHETTHVPFTHPSASESIPPDVPVASVEPEDSVQTMSTRRITFKRPPNPLDRAEPPKRTRGDDDDDHSALLSACQHDLERVSENLKGGTSVFSGIGMPDMSDSAWLAIKIKAETSNVETSTEAKSLEPLQKDVDNVLITVSFSLDEETIQQICSNPDPCGLSEMKTVSFMLCAWFTSMTSCLRAVTLHLENMSLIASTICTNGESGSHECSNRAVHTGTRGGFEISFAEYAKEISIITLPSHRRRDRKSKITPLELSQLRALNVQLFWLGMQCLPQLLAPLSLLMGQTPQATVGTIYEVNKLARKATAWARIHAYHADGWTTRPDGTSQGGQLVFKANCELLQGRESNMSLISWHPSRLERVARSSSAAETQAAADGDDEAVYIRLCLKEVCSGSWICKTGNLKRDKFLLLWWWTVVVSTTPGSLFVLLSWSERQEIWPAGTCAQTESR